MYRRQFVVGGDLQAFMSGERPDSTEAFWTATRLRPRGATEVDEPDEEDAPSGTERYGAARHADPQRTGLRGRKQTSD
jgi:hypothetical protein